MGSILWPEKTIEDARTLLLNCLNTHRAEKLSPAQVMLIFHKAKESGFHSSFQWFANECGYDAHPISKKEEVDRLATTISEASKTLDHAISALAKIQGTVKLVRNNA